MVSKKSQCYRVFSNEKICQWSPLNMWTQMHTQTQKVVYSLTTGLNQRLYKVSTKFDKNMKFSVNTKKSDTTVTLKYKHGNWKWNEWVKLNKYYHQAKLYLSKNIKMLKVLPHTDTWLAVWLAQHWSLYAHIFYVNQNTGWWGKGRGKERRWRVQALYLYRRQY